MFINMLCTVYSVQLHSLQKENFLYRLDEGYDFQELAASCSINVSDSYVHVRIQKELIPKSHIGCTILLVSIVLADLHGLKNVHRKLYR